MDNKQTKTEATRLDAAQAERMVIAQEDMSEKIEAIFNVLNAPPGPSILRSVIEKLLNVFGGVMANMTKEGNSKFTAVIVLGLAAIANGMAFSGWGLETTSKLRCGPGTEESEGWCVVAKSDPKEEQTPSAPMADDSKKPVIPSTINKALKSL